jgi:mono/diheme cytochrome c family protein
MFRGRVPLVVVLGALWLRGVLLAQAPAAQSPRQLTLDTGQDIFEAACIGCHGPGGKGQPQTTLGFEPPDTFPDFSDCNGSTREKIYDWKATIHEGGPGRGFSEIMPSFAEALTLEQIDKVMAYLREQCAETAWPLGELNFPRPLATEKAFPEDEWLVTNSIDASGEGSVSSDIVYEKRFGARNQLEIVAPFNFVQQGNDWAGGVGDLVLAYKRVLMSSLASGSILSVQGELGLPTGNSARGLGSGVARAETFAAFGQILPRLSFVQLQAGVELPTDTEKSPRAAFGRMAIGKTFAQNNGFGRSWTPMAEILADRDLETGAQIHWDVIPQIQVTLNKRQHVRINVGIRRPLNDASSRTTQVLFYALWDFFDGGLRDGW